MDYIPLLQVICLIFKFNIKLFTVFQKLMKNITILFHLFNVNYHKICHSSLPLLAYMGT